MIKRGGRRACFHATILTNVAILVTFGNLSAQPISSIIFQCSTFFIKLYHTEFEFLWSFIDLRAGKNVFKYPTFVLSFKGNNLPMRSLVGPLYLPVHNLFHLPKK